MLREVKPSEAFKLREDGHDVAALAPASEGGLSWKTLEEAVSGVRFFVEESGPESTEPEKPESTAPRNRQRPKSAGEMQMSGKSWRCIMPGGATRKSRMK